MQRWMLLILLALICFLASVPIYGGTYFTFLTSLAFIYIIISIGLNILTGYTGLFSLGHAGLAAMGAYVTALLSKGLMNVEWMSHSGCHILVAMVGGVVLACLAKVLVVHKHGTVYEL